MTSGIIIQARDNSTRLPLKISKSVGGRLLLERVISNCLKSDADLVVVASPSSSCNIAQNIFVGYTKNNPESRNRLKFYKHFGSDNDVLSRYYEACLEYKLNEKDSIICRITSDCALIDESIINLVIKAFKYYKPDVMDFTSVDGLEVQCANFEAIETANKNAHHDYQREHVFPYLYENKDIFRIMHLEDVKLSIDNNDDIKRISEIIMM